MGFRSQKQYEALQAARQRHDSEGGKEEYKRRAGIEGAIQHLPFPVEGNALQYKSLVSGNRNYSKFSLEQIEP
jgi:hypothetical protein